jgi:hypothetical protein
MPSRLPGTPISDTMDAMTTPILGRENLLRQITDLRCQIEPEFRPDTAAQGFTGTAPSTGHCAAVAVIVQKTFGGEFVSAIVEGGSHWFNRIETLAGKLDVDVTADQFNRRSIETAAAGTLYDGTRVRNFEDLNAETLQRALLLARRSRLAEVVTFLDEVLAPRTSAAHR